MELDITETIQELEKRYFDKSSVENRIAENCRHHQDLFNTCGLLPLKIQNFNPLEIQRVYRYYLYSQLSIMMIRKLEDCGRG